MRRSSPPFTRRATPTSVNAAKAANSAGKPVTQDKEAGLRLNECILRRADAENKEHKQTNLSNLQPVRQRVLDHVRVVQAIAPRLEQRPQELPRILNLIRVRVGDGLLRPG